MERFARLFTALDRTTSTKEKVTALEGYFREERPENAVWALTLLTGKTRKRVITSRVLRQIFLAMTEVPEWLFDESRAHVGDTAETIALLMPDRGAGEPTVRGLAVWMEEIGSVRDLDEVARAARVRDWWSGLDRDQVFLLNKVLTGAFRVGVSRKLVIRGLARAHGLDEATTADRLMGGWSPDAAFYARLVDPDESDAEPGRPYPFFLASPLEEGLARLGEPHEWIAEWKWDGIRAQVIRRAGRLFIWSRGEDLVTDRFPELHEPFAALPDGAVLDGEILAFRDEEPLPFALLQKRIGRKKLGPKILAEAPVAFIAYDLLEWDGIDRRVEPLTARTERLTELVTAIDSPLLRLSPRIAFGEWYALEALRTDARARNVEGLMIKRATSPYRGGRKRGDWWKHKVDPFTLDAVMIYAQAGSGRRANLFTDYTFALWDGEALVPFAKAYSGLDNAEIGELDRWIRRHTRERFGPIRAVEPVQVFEIAFEGISASKRHKSGVAVRFPRIHRWRKDKPSNEADTLEAAMALL